MNQAQIFARWLPCLSILIALVAGFDTGPNSSGAWAILPISTASAGEVVEPGFMGSFPRPGDTGALRVASSERGEQQGEGGQQGQQGEADPSQPERGGTSQSDQSDQSDGSAGAEAQAASGGESSTVEPSESAETEQEEEEEREGPADWEAKVDEWFGYYLVTPMNTVLFFDFYTGPASGNDADNDGIPDHPWVAATNSLRNTLGVSKRGWLRLGPATVTVDVSAVPQVAELIEETDRLKKGTEEAHLVVSIEDGKYVVTDANGNAAIDSRPETNSEGAKKVASIIDGLVTTKTSGTSVPFVVLWLLLGGIFFTLRMTFINIRAFGHAIRLVKGDYDDPEDEGDVSHFQALSAALSATVGLGNIAGVAIAISTGGPGATFWMVVIGLVGMTTKFTECTLGQMYRKTDVHGQITGGPMHYLRDGLAEMGLKPLGLILAFAFSILCIGGSIGGGNTFQVVQSLGAIREAEALWFLDKFPWIYGLIMVTLVGLVIVGGIKSIGRVAGRVVPFMCCIYVLFAIVILATNSEAVPGAFQMIFAQAFSPQAVYGGFLGVLVIGITRAVFSNEAGTGSAAIAHSAARTDIPIREGIVALMEPFIDTVVVCTMTALVIIITGAYSADATEVIRNEGNGAALTSFAFAAGGNHAFGNLGADLFRYVLYAAVFLFAFSTCISWSYYGERCFTYWFGQQFSLVYKVIFLIFTFLGSIVSAQNIQAFSDILILSMALPNVLGVLLLSGKVRRAMDDYWNQVRSGQIQPPKAKK